MQNLPKVIQMNIQYKCIYRTEADSDLENDFMVNRGEAGDRERLGI